MSSPNSWHDQDQFWELLEPVLFSEQRQQRAETEIDTLIELLQIKQQDHILDLCCGSGRHSLALAQRGYVVVGVDRTQSYIENARQAAANRDLDVKFTVSDMRGYSVPDGFDIILNLFGSFGYFADPMDDRKVVEQMFASLRPGGKFLIETMGKEILARTFQPRDWSETGDLLVLSEKTVGESWGRIHTRWIVIKGTQRFKHNVSVRSYSAVELSNLLTTCGFVDVQVFGNLAGAAYDQAAESNASSVAK